MPTLIAFVADTDPAKEDPHWERVMNPPCVVSYGQDDFVEMPDGDGRNGYVNGFGIIGGLHVLEAGDLVRLTGSQGTICFRYAGRCVAQAEAGEGRRCSFTGMPIKGPAVRCPNPKCGRLVSEQVAQQIGKCVCNSPLKKDEVSEPEEELL